MKTLQQLFGIMVLLIATPMASWIHSGKDAAYPKDMYFTAVGASENSAEEARRNAQVEVRKQVSVDVRATQTLEKSNFTYGDYEFESSDYNRFSRLRVHGDIQGIEVVRENKDGNVFYAFAILDKAMFAKRLRQEIAEKNELMRQYSGEANLLIEKNRLSEAVHYLGKISALREEIGDKRSLLSAVGDFDASTMPVVDPSQLAKMYAACVKSLKLEVVSGNNQKIGVGELPAQAVVVQVSSGGKKVPDMPISLIGNNRRLITKFSDSTGRVEFILSEGIDLYPGKHFLSVGIRMPVKESRLRRKLRSLDENVLYSVNAEVFHVRLESHWNGKVDKAEMDDALIWMLSKGGIKVGSKGPLLVVRGKVESAGGVRGLSENSSFLKTRVSLSFADKKGSIVGTKELTGIGGSLIKGAVSALKNARLTHQIKSIRDLGSSSSLSKKKSTIAILPLQFEGGVKLRQFALQVENQLNILVFNDGRFEILERDILDRIVAEQVFSGESEIEGADWILSGKLFLKQEQLNILFRLVETKSSKVIFQKNIVHGTDFEQQLKSLVARI